ncbi:translation initiation factor IF-2 [Fusarium solani]|nr:translation initiation factor IF-2 [Fusarium solani]
MLRARALQGRGNSFVCAYCRFKLSPKEAQLRDRPVSTSIISTGAPGLLPCHPMQSLGVRALSTSSPLHRPDDKGSPPKPGGFPGSGFPGGFGAGVGSFGSFGVAKSTPDTAKPTSLLPHELEARSKMGLAPKKPAPVAKVPDPPQTALASQEHDKKRKNKKQKQKRQNKAEDRAENRAALSTALAEAFKTDRTPAPVATPKAWSSNELEKPAAPATPASPAWGAFSSRKIDTQLPTREPQSQAKPVEKQLPKAPVTPERPTGEAAWGEMKRAARTTSDSTEEKGGDFWDALETRVSGFRGKPGTTSKSSSPQVSPGAVQDFWSQDLQTPQEQQPRRKSRFEAEEEVDDRRGKKGKRPKNVRKQQDDDEDWDEDSIRRWELRQRKKAEKDAKKRLEEEANNAPVPIFLPEYISVANLAQALQIRNADFLHDLETMGFEELTNDTIMTGDTAALVAQEYGFDPTVDTGSQRDLRPRPAAEDPSSLPSRPPVVTIMGHVDHGKTTLLDWLRKSSIAAQEHGGITQHIGAFVVQMSSGKQITFLDTPGHAAFLSMRQRGANVTDIVVLVVAADDSVMPQTIEALKHATAAKVPIIVAINKIDKEDARVEQVKLDLSRNGVELEEFGGDVQVVPVSGKTGKGMEDLEENIVTLSEILDVRAETDGMAEGWILESSVKQTGKVASVLVKRGTLRLGDYIVAGKTWAKVRGLRNEAGAEIPEAPPGTPVQVLGWRDLPEAGEQVIQAPDESKAKTAVEYRQEMADREESSQQLAEQEHRQREKAAAEEAAAAAEAEGIEAEAGESEPGIIFQNFIVKADVAGSVEAVCGTVQELGSNEVQSKILRSSVGLISEYDVDHAAASKSIIINFNNTILPHIRHRADEAGVRIIDHSVIYHVVDDVKAALSDLLPYKISHKVLGEADVLQLFAINIKKRVQKTIAGCKIRNGSIKRTSMVKVIRAGEVVYEGKIDTLKHVKKDVMEMGKGTECGIGFDDFQDLEIDDQIQTYEVLKEKRTL